jgi:excisionase family DNA binding protein
MTPNEAAERLQVKRSRISQLCKIGRLDCKKVGGRVVITAESVRARERLQEAQARHGLKRAGRKRIEILTAQVKAKNTVSGEL